MYAKATLEQRETFAVALADGLDIPDAAARADLSPSWGYLTARDPEILARVKEIQAPAVDNVRRLAKHHAQRAIKRLAECMEPGYNLGNSADANIRAALAILKFAEAEPATRHQVGGDPDNAAPIVVERTVYKAE